MANPFEYGDQPRPSRGTSEESANARMERVFQEKLEGTREDQREDEPAELDADGGFTPDTEPERATRQDKKQSRYKEATARADAAEERMARMEADHAAERAAARYQQRQPQAPVRDIIEEQITANHRSREDVAEEFHSLQTTGKMTDERRRSLIEKQQGLERHGQELVWQQMDRRKDANRDPQKETMNQLTSRHPDVMGNKKAFQYAEGMARMRQAEGEAFGHDLVDDVMEKTRKHFEMGKYKNGVPNEQAYASPGKGGGGGVKTGGKIRMTASMRRLADHAYPHIKNEKERWTKWAKTAGKSFLERESKEGR